jgi:thiosulfate/3-mercaptopyruvate sulfurtransferase
VGGGFPRIGSLYSHRFRETPDMNEQCTACHGSRVGTDYRGEIEGNQPDAHRTAGMQCNGCHTREEIHGDGNEYASRYEVANMPRCEDCHEQDIQVDAGGGNCTLCHPDGFGSATVPAAQLNHAHHGGIEVACSHCHDPVPSVALPVAQCQTCHSQPYKNCTNCHNLTDEGYDILPSVVQLKIGRNPSPHREEYDIAIVRHTPIDPGTFANWGLDLPDYLSKSTWQYASPHNILRATPQTAVEPGGSCYDACHGSPDGPDGYLLRESDLYEEDGVTRLVDYDANIDYVIPEGFPAK